MKFEHYISLIIVLFLCGCSSLHQKISTKNLNRLKKIAIISDLGPELQYHYAGSTSLRNREQKKNISWELDTFIAQTIQSNLKKNSHFSLIEIKGQEFSQRPYFDQMVTLKKNGADINPYLEKLLQEGFDGLVLIQGWKQIEDSLINPGFGIIYDNRLLVHDQNFYLTAKIRVYSTHKKSELAAIDLWKNPYLELENYPKRKTFEEWPEADLVSLQTQIQEKCTHEIPFRLIKLGML